MQDQLHLFAELEDDVERLDRMLADDRDPPADSDQRTTVPQCSNCSAQDGLILGPGRDVECAACGWEGTRP